MVACALNTYFAYASDRQLLESAREKELRTLGTSILNNIQAQSDKAAARASLVCNLVAVQEAFRAGDRELLASRLVPAFLVQREKFGVREGQFHLAPAISFLRVFDLANFGEDLSPFREMVLAANRNPQPQKGIEIGRRGLSIRGIDLVRDAQGPIGSFEVGMSFSPLLADVKSSTGYEAGAFVEDKLMTAIATGIPRPDAERIIGEYQSVEATNWQVIRGMVNADLLERSNDVTLRTKTVDGIEYGLVLVPMLDYRGKQIGALVAVGSFEASQRALKAALVKIVCSALFQAVLILGALITIINVLFVRPLLAAQAKAAAATPAPEAAPRA